MKTPQLQELARSLAALKKTRSEKGPQNDEELHAWIKSNLKMDIPRVAVCEDHQSPFQFLSDIYFERVTSAIAMANRGGSKTMLSAVIHLLNSIYKPGCESLSVGAIEAQSQRAYDNLVKILKVHGQVDVAIDHPLVTTQIKRQTDFKNGSKVEIVPGTIAAVNGPHPQKVHGDEIELMDPSVFQESRNMSQSKFVTDSEGNEIEIKAQDWLTSTRKRAHGPMQQIIDEVREAERNGFDPPFKLYTWCVFETARNVPNCQVSNPDLPEDQRCKCDKIVKGEWEDGSPRTFKSVCQGRLANSRGFLSLGDIHKKFQEASRDTWEAQQECSKPEVGGSVFKQFNRERFGVKWYDPDPAFGDIYMGVDFGGTNPHAVNWYQVLRVDVDVWGTQQSRSDRPQRRLTAGTRVCFDEIYMAEIGNIALAELVIAKENAWRKIHPHFQVKRRFADVAAKAARLDWATKQPVSLPTQWYVTRDIKEHIKTCNAVLDERKFAVDLTRCPMFVKEAEDYHYPPKKPEMEYDPEIPVDDFNHCMSNFRYVMENLKWMEVRNMGGRISSPKTSMAGARRITNATKSSAPRYMPRTNV